MRQLTTEEARDLKFYGIEKETQVCANCQHFRRHYDASGNPFFLGHCCYPQVKTRKIYENCVHFAGKKEVNP